MQQNNPTPEYPGKDAPGSKPEEKSFPGKKPEADPKDPYRGGSQYPRQNETDPRRRKESDDLDEPDDSETPRPSTSEYEDRRRSPYLRARARRAAEPAALLYRHD